MATLVAFVDFDITQLDLNFYARHLVQSDLGDNVNTSFFGVTYPDEFAINANDGSLDLGLFLLGSGFVQDAQGNISAGTVNAIAEGELSTQSLLWYAQGLSLSAVAIRDAVASLASDDDAQLLALAFAGDDTFVLSPFDDLVATFGGNDTVTGGGGDDVLDGGEGTDTAVYTQGIDGVTAQFQEGVLFLTVPGAGTDQLSNFEFVRFGSVTRSVESLSDLVKPQIVSASPADGATGIAADQSIAITFGENIARGTGTITLREFGPAGTPVASFDVATSAAITVSGALLTIDPPANLEAGIRYFVVIPEGAVTDSVGNRFAGTTGYDFTVFGNPPAFADSSRTLATTEDTALQFTAPASDPDGGTLTYAATGAQKGAVTRGADGTFTYTPFANANGTDTFTLTVTDRGGLSGNLAVSISISPVNDPPSAAATRTVFVTAGSTAPFVVVAGDVDGDQLTHSATTPQHGSLTGGANGSFTYAPASGFLGSDSAVVTIDDQKGGTAFQTVSFIVQPNWTDNWRLFTQSGLVAGIGGSGQIFGNNGFDDISVFDQPGRLTFDASFNRGGDILRLAGDARDWFALVSGSNAFLSDGDTNLVVPIGTAGLALDFADGARILRFDQTLQTVLLGEQALSASAVALAGEPADIALTGDPSETASGRVFLSSPGVEPAQVTLGGKFTVFGTNDVDEVTLLSGDIVLDASFNRGGDRIVFDQPAQTFAANLSGSNARLESPLLIAVIPIGTEGAILAFAGGDERGLAFDIQASAVTLGDQQLALGPISLAPFA